MSGFGVNKWSQTGSVGAPLLVVSATEVNRVVSVPITGAGVSAPLTWDWDVSWTQLLGRPG